MVRTIQIFVAVVVRVKLWYRSARGSADFVNCDKQSSETYAVSRARLNETKVQYSLDPYNFPETFRVRIQILMKLILLFFKKDTAWFL